MTNALSLIPPDLLPCYQGYALSDMKIRKYLIMIKTEIVMHQVHYRKC